MKNIIYILIGSLAAILGIGLFSAFRNQDGQDEKKEGAGGLSKSAPPPVEPPPKKQGEEVSGEPEKPLDPEAGEGKRLIESRMKAIENSAKKREIINQSSPNYYNGVGEFKTDLMTVMGSIFQGQNNLPVYSYELQPTWEQFLENIKQAEDFDPMSQGAQVERAIANWKGLLTFGPTGISFWPPNLAQLIEQGYFQASGPADKDRSERYGAFTSGMKVVANNLQGISRSYTNNLRAEALRDLVNAGYKFIGVS